MEIPSDGSSTSAAFLAFTSESRPAWPPGRQDVRLASRAIPPRRTTSRWNRSRAALAALAAGDAPLLLTEEPTGPPGLPNRVTVAINFARPPRDVRSAAVGVVRRTPGRRRPSGGRNSSEWRHSASRSGMPTRSNPPISSGRSPTKRVWKTAASAGSRFGRAQHGRHAGRDARQSVRKAKAGEDRRTPAQYLAARRWLSCR